MTTRKTLTFAPRADDAAAPAIKKKGRGWEISEKRLDAIHERARVLRRNSSEAHQALAARFAKADFGRYTFKRHAVVGSVIVDFNCNDLRLAILIDETEDGVLESRRDKSLEAVGVTVVHVKAADILTDMDAVLARLTEVIFPAMAQKQANRRASRPRPQYGDAPRGGPRSDGPRGGPRSGPRPDGPRRESRPTGDRFRGTARREPRSSDA
jgi:very-short-patch-repair endonuclease